MLFELLGEAVEDRLANVNSLGIADFKRLVGVGLAMLKPLVAEGDVEVLDFLANLIKVLDRERLVEACKGVYVGGYFSVKLTAVIVFGVLLIVLGRFLALLTAQLFLACAFSLLTFFGGISVTRLLNEVRNSVLFGGVNRVLHASELGTYLVKEFGKGRTAFVHLRYSALCFENELGATLVKFIGHAVLLNLGEKILAIIRATH